MNTAPQGHSAENNDRIEVIELPLLLEAMFQRYGYDFRGYAPASLGRRLRRAMREEGLVSLSALQDRILHSPEAMARFLDIVSVDVTAMFRDPGFYRVFREKIVPALRDLPPVRIWHAGCSTGEEVYSTAIVLHEEGLLDKIQIYATDLNERSLARASEGIFPISTMQEYTANYRKAGGRADFSDYYTAQGDAVILREFLRRDIVWAEHSLVTDSSFNEFQVIFCRNVMIYFGRPLQERVHRLLFDSLAAGGFLGLGRSESLQFTPYEGRYEAVDRAERWYRKARP